MKIYTILISILILSITVQAQNDHKALRKGDQAYKKGNYSGADEEYLRAIEKNPNSVKGHYNRGNAIYKSIDPNVLNEEEKEQMNKRLEKAAAEYLAAIENAKDNDTKSKAYHNLGNTYVSKNDLAQGIEAYKNALRLNPQDMETKQNLQYAIRQMQMQEQQQQQQQQGEKEQQEGEQQEQQQSQQQEEQEGEKQEQQQQQAGDEQKEKDSEEGEEQNSQSQEGKEEEMPTPEEMTKEEVLRQLKVMDEEEKKVQEKLKKEQYNQYKSDKDW